MQRTTVCIWIVVLTSATTSGWNYDESTEEGPSHWVDTYPSCNGANQSPIDINSTSSLPFHGLSIITFTNYGRISTSHFTLINNGHSALVQVNSKDVTIAGAGLSSTYVLEQFHIHWSSEHLVDSVAHPLEIHFVHYNSARYPDVATAAASGDPEAIAVLGVFADIDNGNPNPEIGSVISHVSEILYEGDSKFVDAFSLQNLLPQSNLRSFYRYNGSLTTPGCNEVVVWTVFTQPIYVSETQLTALNQLHVNMIGDLDEFLIRNNRPVQAVNSRIVYRAT